MKRVLIAFTICLLSIPAFAQNKDTTPIVMNGQVIMNANEFKLINVQQQINKKLILQINPNGVILRF